MTTVTTTTTRVILSGLKRRLRRLGITQDMIARRAGVSRPYVNHYLNGRRSPEHLRDAIASMVAEREGGRQ